MEELCAKMVTHEQTLVGSLSDIIGTVESSLRDGMTLPRWIGCVVVRKSRQLLQLQIRNAPGIHAADEK